MAAIILELNTWHTHGVIFQQFKLLVACFKLDTLLPYRSLHSFSGLRHLTVSLLLLGC